MKILCTLTFTLFSGLSVIFAAGSTAFTPDSIPNYRLGEIVVIAEAGETGKAANIQQITREQIELLDVHEASQALQFSPGIHIYRTVRNEIAFQLHGFEQRQVNVFLDGIPISVPFDGVVDISQLAGDDIESIRISRGLPSTLYGANTLGGSVNILTNHPAQHPEFRGRAEGSAQGRFFTSMHYRGAVKKLRFSTSFSWEKSSDYSLPKDFQPILNENGGKRDNSAFRKSSLAVKLSYTPNQRNQVGAQFRLVDNWFHVPPQALVNRPRYWRFPEWKKTVFSLNSRHILGKTAVLRSVLFYDTYRNKLQSFDDNSYTTQFRKYAFNSIYDDYTLGAILYPQMHLLSFGNTSGLVSLKRDVHREKGVDNQPFEKYSTDTWTFGLEQNFRIDRHISGNAGLDGNYLKPVSAANAPLRSSLFLLNGQASLQVQVTRQLSLNFSMGKKSRFPTLKELYSERLGRNIANPDLQAEHSWNKQAGLSWVAGPALLEFSLFHNQLSDLIANRQLGNNTRQLQNIDQSLMYGMEVSTRWQFSRGIVDINYTYLNARNQSVGRTADYLEYRPVHRLNGICRYSASRLLTFQLEGNYTADQHFQNPNTGAWEKLTDFALLSGKIDLRVFSGLGIYFRVDNIFDRLYFGEFGVPSPGRELISGIRFVQ